MKNDLKVVRVESVVCFYPLLPLCYKSSESLKDLRDVVLPLRLAWIIYLLKVGRRGRGNLYFFQKTIYHEHTVILTEGLEADLETLKLITFHIFKINKSLISLEVTICKYMYCILEFIRIGNFFKCLLKPALFRSKHFF